LTPSASFPGISSNASLVAHYAKESSKHLAAGIVTLGDMGYKKLSRYCSELRPDSSSSIQLVNSSPKGNGIVNGHSTDADNIGMVNTALHNFAFACYWNLRIVLDYLQHRIDKIASIFPILGCKHLV